MEQLKKIDLINIRNNHQISLADGNPTVTEEWHPFLNGDFKPEHFSCGSEKEVWWLGKCGHEWKTKIFVRALHASGCPYCSNKKVLTGFNDLESKYPDVAKTWHPTKNADITPSTILYSTEKKVWWMCEKGHEYEASVFSRTINQSRCPYCSNKEILKGFNDLESHFPNVAKEWHPTKNIGLVDGNGKDISTPDKVVFGATHKVWWIGSCGHEYEARICHRTVYNSGCPYCDGKKVLPGFNDLETRYPEVAKLWHPTLNGDLKPTDVVARGQHKPWWLCPNGHSYQSSLGSRTDGCGCPICDGKQVLKGFNDLESQYPNLAKQWHSTKNGDLKPSEVFAGGHKSVWWRCESGHDYRAPIQQRTLQGCGCPYCAGQKVWPGFNDLATTHPHLVEQWHPTKNGNIKPTDVIAGTRKRVWWMCRHGHEWNSSISTRALQGCGCPYCAGSKVWPGFNDLATKYPELAKEFHPTKNGKLSPSSILAGGNTKIWWLGKCGHEWDASILNRLRYENCPYCNNRRILVGFNDLATTHSHLVKQWHPTKNGNLKPTDVIAGSEKKIWWICEKGHEWKTTIKGRAVKGYGCPICNESRGEKETRNVLLKNNISFKEQYVFNDRRSSFGGLLKDDFAILHKDKVVATIEYHGLQHYEVVDFSGHDPERAKKNFERCQIRDKEKTDYLNKHHIPQLIIPYWKYDNIEPLVTDFLKERSLINEQ